LYLLQHIRPILDILSEMANMAPDLLVGFQAKRDNGHEAKGKPFPALRDAPREVAAVLTLHGDVFGAFEGGVEDWGGWLVGLGGEMGTEERTMGAAGEEEEHGWWRFVVALWR
jgi:hypothetical protein